MSKLLFRQRLERASVKPSIEYILSPDEGDQATTRPSARQSVSWWNRLLRPWFFRYDLPQIDEHDASFVVMLYEANVLISSVWHLWTHSRKISPFKTVAAPWMKYRVREKRNVKIRFMKYSLRLSYHCFTIPSAPPDILDPSLPAVSNNVSFHEKCRNSTFCGLKFV